MPRFLARSQASVDFEPYKGLWLLTFADPQGPDPAHEDASVWTKQVAFDTFEKLAAFMAECAPAVADGRGWTPRPPDMTRPSHPLQRQADTVEPYDDPDLPEMR